MTEEQKRTAGYVPWATFKNALDQLAKGMPSRIDRSVFPGIGWTPQNQLFVALRFLGLLKGDDEPTPLLDELVKGTEEERKAKLGKVIRDSYSELIAIDLTKATRSHFEETLGTLYNVTGDTRVKAVRFFLSAAEFIGLPLSAFILPKPGKANGNGGARRTRQSAPRIARKNPPPPVQAGTVVPPTTGTARTVDLASGGTLTISATKDYFGLNAKDRKFFSELVDKLEAYEADPDK